MTQPFATPVSGAERIGELDIIRGFALFGVLWANLFSHAELAVPDAVILALPTAPADHVIRFLGYWLIAGKAQALFSLLFGFGFAILTERAQRRGADGTRLYARRVGLLFALGIAHFFLLWMGDILHAYAAMGFLLLLTRRWPSWLLLAVGLPLCLFTFAGVRELDQLLLSPESREAIGAAGEALKAQRYEIFLGHDYLAYVRILIRSAWDDLYAQMIGVAFLGNILGRFMVGSWIHRRGWMQDTARHAAGFRRAALILLTLGLTLAIINPGLRFLDLKAPETIRPILRLIGQPAQLTLALGYAAGLVVLCQTPAIRRLLSGLGAVGQMALTNYLMQSLVYMFVLYGFGLGWLRYAGPTFCLALALTVFAAQIVFSRWWLARFRFGPAEWLWRSATYGRWQPWRRGGMGQEAVSAVA